MATAKPDRNKGIMKEMFANTLRDLYNNQECFTYLIPSSTDSADIYKLGFEYVMDKSVGIKVIRKRPTHSLVLRKADFSDLSRLSIFAQSYMESKYGVFLSKDREYFKNIFSLMDAEGGKVELYFENKIVLGYRIGFEDEILEEVLDKGVEALSWQRSEVKPYAMARLLDIPTTLKMIGTSNVGEVVIKLKDDIIEENNGIFLMQYDRNKIQWKKTNMKPDIEITIGDFTAHILGYAKFDKLPEMNMKSGFYINDYV